MHSHFGITVGYLTLHTSQCLRFPSDDGNASESYIPRNRSLQV